MRITGCLLLLTILASCNSLHMQPEEKFLSPAGTTGKIMIISHLSDDPEESSVSLLIIPPADSAAGATAFLSLLNSKDRSPLFYHNDSIIPVEQAVFPVVYRRFPEMADGFDFYLYRNKLLFNGYGTKERMIELTFGKQLPFITDSAANRFHGIAPISTGKNGKLFIHVLSHADSLFEKGTNTSYCWIDYTVRNEGFTLYYSQTTSGEKSILYSTGNPNFSGLAVNDPLVIKIVHPTGQTIEFRPLSTEKFQPQKSGFVSTMATVFEGDEQVGTAVIYYLAQP